MDGWLEDIDADRLHPAPAFALSLEGYKDADSVDIAFGGDCAAAAGDGFVIHQVERRKGVFEVERW